MGNVLVEQFQDILKTIKNDDFRNIVIEIMKECPDYISFTPSSTTGKYHPEDEIGDNGMVYHVQRFAVIAEELVRMVHEDNDTFGTIRSSDILVATAMLHDIYKQGPEINKTNADGVKLPKHQYTQKLHPLFIFKTMLPFVEKHKGDQYLYYALWDLAYCCALHEGRWTVDMVDEAVKGVQTPENFTSTTKKLVKLAHLADYIASRRTISDVFQYNKEEAKGEKVETL